MKKGAKKKGAGHPIWFGLAKGMLTHDYNFLNGWRLFAAGALRSGSRHPTGFRRGLRGVGSSLVFQVQLVHDAMGS